MKYLYSIHNLWKIYYFFCINTNDTPVFYQFNHGWIMLHLQSFSEFTSRRKIACILIEASKNIVFRNWRTFLFQCLYITLIGSTSIFKALQYLMLHTPHCVPSPVVNRDVVDTEDVCQVYPPGGVQFFVTRNGTLSSKDTQVWFQSIHSVTSLGQSFGESWVRVLLICRFVQCYIFW